MLLDASLVENGGHREAAAMDRLQIEKLGAVRPMVTRSEKDTY